MPPLRFASISRALQLCCAVLLINASSASPQSGDGYVGIYADSTGTVPCAVVPPGQGRTLYVIAKLAGATADGIMGLEFRIEVSNPTGWYITYSGPPGATLAIGNALDTVPDSVDASGTNVAYSACSVPSNGRVDLGTIFVFNINGAPTTFAVKAHNSPSNSNYACPLLIRCDLPVLSKACMSPSGTVACTLTPSKPSLANGAERTVAVFESVLQEEEAAVLTPIWTLTMEDSVTATSVAVGRNDFAAGAGFPVPAIPVCRIEHLGNSGHGWRGLLYTLGLSSSGTLQTVSPPMLLSTTAWLHSGVIYALDIPENHPRVNPGIVEWVSPGDVQQASLECSPNGDICIISGSGTLLRTRQGTVRLDSRLTGPVFSDGLRRFVAHVSNPTTRNGEIVVVDYDGNVVFWTGIKGLEGDFRPWALAQAGRRVLVRMRPSREREENVLAVSLETGEVTRVAHHALGRPIGFGDGVMLTDNYEGEGTTRLRFYDTTGQAPALLWQRTERRIICDVAVSPDGRFIAYQWQLVGSTPRRGLRILGRNGATLAVATPPAHEPPAHGVVFVGPDLLLEGTSAHLSETGASRKLNLYRLP